ncbi:MAG: CoA protein activase [Peptococcaceae bacterium]|nr:CoA protein activase [Peptococcaceae bacterium]MDH7525302.1 CoA protein activase [Peptococcaceae bacterium]
MAKITFPHMGHTWVILKGLLEYLDLSVIVPPATSKRTLSLGVQHAPEFACLPLKLNLGNLIEARELGADTFIMAGGVGPCRFGLYAQLEREILEELGYGYDSLVLEPPERGIWRFLQRIKRLIGPVSWLRVIQAIRFAYYKACLIDDLERMVQEIRPRELKKGTADKVFNHSLLTIDRAQNRSELEEAFGLARQKLLHVPIDEESGEVLKVGLVGEIFTLLEPFASLEMEKKLGYLGALVTRSIYLSEWINEHLFMGLFRKKASRKPFKHYASPFLNHFVGGHGQESIGAGVAFAAEGFDGVVQVAPLTCMPEIVAHTIFPRVSENCGIPVLTVYVDEQMGQEGVNTRLEAFIDLLREKRGSLDRRMTIC